MWAKLPDDTFTDELIDLSQDAMLLHCCGLTLCAKKLTDGYLSPDNLRLAAAAVKVRHEESASEELVAAGLWEFRPDGAFYITTYLRDNPSAEQVARERKGNASRQQNLRDRQRAERQADQAQRAADVNAKRNGVTNAVTNAVSHTVGHAVSHGAPVPVSRTRIPSPVPDPVPQEYGADAPAPSALNQVTLVLSSDSEKPKIEIAVPKPTRDTCLSATQLGEFDRWWFGPWPKERRVKRKQAEEAWKKVNPTGTLTETILAGTERQHQGRRWRQGFIADPPGWLRERRWEDEIELEDIPAERKDRYDDDTGGTTASPQRRDGAAVGVGRGGSSSRGGHRTYRDGDHWPERD